MSLRILVAEDEALIAMQIEMDLLDAGYQVVGPHMSVAKCIEALETVRIDAAVLDVDLAGNDVFPVADLLSEQGIPFIFHTGRLTHATISSRFPDSAVCIKPCNISKMLDKLGLPAAAP